MVVRAAVSEHVGHARERVACDRLARLRPNRSRNTAHATIIEAIERWKNRKAVLTLNVRQVGAKTMDFEHIEEQLVERLPEIRPAAESYWRQEGRPGEDCGAYIFVESMFATYLEALLALPPSAKRDRLLARAFAVVDEMLRCPDQDVENLAFIGIFEGHGGGWLLRSAPFLGPAAMAELNTYSPGWREGIADPNQPPTVEAIDLYGVRALIAAELNCPLESIPGHTP